MCDTCAIPVQIPPELLTATQQQAIANATERLNRMRQENQTYKALTATEVEHTKQAETLRNYEQSKTQSDAEKFQIKQQIDKEKNQQLNIKKDAAKLQTQTEAEKLKTQAQINKEAVAQLNQTLAFEQEKTKALTEKLKALAGTEQQKALQASQTFELEKMNTEYQSQKCLKQAEEWELDLKELDTRICEQKKLFALKHGC
jgi:hypothetical protein